MVDLILVNGNTQRRNIVIGGHFRLKVANELGYKEVPVVYIDIADEAKEKELNIRLNKNLGDWDYEMLAEFDESLLSDIGFDSTELDEIFDLSEDEPETFDLQKELEKLDIKKVNVQKGDVYQLGDSRLMCGDSTIHAIRTISQEKSPPFGELFSWLGMRDSPGQQIKLICFRPPDRTLVRYQARFGECHWHSRSNP